MEKNLLAKQNLPTNFRILITMDIFVDSSLMDL